MNDDSLYDILKRDDSRENYIDSQQVGALRNSDIKDIMDYVTTKRIDIFDKLNFHLYDNEDKISELILPCVIKTYGKFHITPSNLLKDKKLELYKLLFDVDELINVLIDYINKMKDSLEHLSYIDRTCELLSLIVENYVSWKFQLAYNCENVDKELRDIKLKKLL